MHFRILGLGLLILSGVSSAAPGRSPAVEDFVGIEVEHVEATPHASESLFNLEKDVNRIETVRKDTPIDVPGPQMSIQEKAWSLSTIFGVLFIMGLPLISWLLVMNHMRNKASAESASNIEVLEKYRQEREQGRNKDKTIKKAS